MKGLWKRIVALLTVCLLLIPLVSIGSSAAPDLSDSCSLTVTINQLYADDVDNFVVDLYRVAGLEAAEGYQDTVVPTPVEGPFGALEEDLKPGEYSKHEMEALAQKALLIAADEGYMGYPPISVPLNSMPISDLEAGVYLIVVRGDWQDRAELKEHVDSDTGESSYSTAVMVGSNEYSFAPILTTLPYYQGDDSINTGNGGDWLYDGSVNLKVNRDNRIQKKIILHKTSEGGQKLPNAEFKLYATRVADNESLYGETITTYVEGQGYVTLYCIGTYTTDQNGDIIIDDPLQDDNTLYAWVESKAPNGYELDPEPHFFFAYGMEIPYYYDEWINQPGQFLETHLRYDNEHPNDTAGVSFDRRISGNTNFVALSNESDAEGSVYVRVKTHESYGCYRNGEYLETFDPRVEGSEYWIHGGDGYSYYYKSLAPGESTEYDLRIEIDGTVLTDEDGYQISAAGRLAIVYDFIPVPDGDDGNNPFSADWTWDPQYHDADEMSLLPAGYVIELKSDLRATGTARVVEVCNYNWDFDDRDNGLFITNKIKETPPDKPGTILPETGGIGTVWFTATGAVMIAAASIILVRKKRRFA